MKGYWSNHKYKRRSVESIKSFCGWPYLEKLSVTCKNERDSALISLLFSTGGRISEVLKLKKDNFRIDEKHIILVAMPVLKRYKKIGLIEMANGKKKWRTKKEIGYRTFPIRIDEPLVKYFVNYVDAKKKNIFKIGRIRAYQIITELEPDIYPHWFRSQRASQLAFEYGFQEHDLIEYFMWRNYLTAFRYSRMGWKGLASKMEP